MRKVMIVEDNSKLRPALKAGLEATGKAYVVADCGSGEEALAYFDSLSGNEAVSPGGLAASSKDARPVPEAILMDVQLAEFMNGIQAAVAIRREYPRMPVVFYSIQDDESYYRDFRRSGILSHYAYVRKTNYLLPAMVLPLIEDALAGRSFIDPEIETRVQEVRHKDEHSPMALLESNEQSVARLLAAGLTNEQIAARMGFRDKRTISRTNGQIYAVWGLADNTTDEKVARTRAALIVLTGRLIAWDQDGTARIMNERSLWIPWDPTPLPGF